MTPGPHPRRGWLIRLACAAGLALGGVGPARAQDGSQRLAPVDPRRRLQSPRDHGAHPQVRTEWWYLTGWSGSWDAPSHGFQVTFFRHRTGLAAAHPSRLAARQLLFAHAAITDLGLGRHAHADRIARWSGSSDPGAAASAALEDARVHIGGWRLGREDAGGLSRWSTRLTDDALALDLTLQATQPWLLQGIEGHSRKGPDPGQASHYITEPQLAVQGRLQLKPGPDHAVQGVAWMDHEWSEELLHPQAVGWDWIGMNLRDGSALTAFRLRRADGSTLWAGGSWRRAGGPIRAFEPGEVVWIPGRRWRSAASNADYPVEWTVRTPAGIHTVRSLLDAQELDSRRSTGTVYWEGLSELLDERGQRVGLGYLEMTGYAGRLRL